MLESYISGPTRTSCEKCNCRASGRNTDLRSFEFIPKVDSFIGNEHGKEHRDPKIINMTHWNNTFFWLNASGSYSLGQCLFFSEDGNLFWLENGLEYIHVRQFHIKRLEKNAWSGLISVFYIDSWQLAEVTNFRKCSRMNFHGIRFRIPPNLFWHNAALHYGSKPRISHDLA